jgi:hypothetical protein
MLTRSRKFSLARNIIHHLLVGLMLIGASTAYASKPANITQGEMTLLPPYCIDTMGFGYGDAHTNTSPRAGKWIAMMGSKSFWSLHHYCWGLIDQRRAQFLPTKSPIRTGSLERAIANHQYTITNSTPNFVLLPEIFTKMGEAEAMLSRFGLAFEAFKRASELKPDYDPAYLRWAEALIRSGQKAEAKKVLKSGLENSPGSAELRDQYKLLGGDPSQIKPITKALPTDAVPSEPVQAASEPAPIQ